MKEYNNKEYEKEIETLLSDFGKSIQSVKPSPERMQKRIDLAIETLRILYGEEQPKRRNIFKLSEYFDKLRYSPAFKPALAIACTIIVFIGIYFIGLKKDYEQTSPDVATKIKQIDKTKSNITKNQIVSETLYKIPFHQKSLGIAQTKLPDSVIISDYVDSFNKLSELDLSIDTNNQKQFISDWIRLAGDSLNGDKQSRIVFLLDSSSIKVCFEKQSLSKDSNTLKKIDRNQIIKYFDKLKKNK